MRDVKPIIGYLHTGIEKTAEDKAYWKVIPVVERMDYLSYYFNAMAYCGSVETILDLEVPPRPVPARHPPGAQPDRRLAVAGHGRARPRRDLGVLVRLARPRRDPRPVRDVLGPAHAHALLPGRRRGGGHPLGWVDKVRKFRAGIPGAGRPVREPDRLEPDRARRLRGTGAVDETLLDLGVTGPLLRAAGNRGTCARPTRTRATTTSTSRSRSARSATTTTATACGWPRCASR